MRDIALSSSTLLAVLAAMASLPARPARAELTVTIVEEDPAVVIEGLEPYSTAAIFSIWREQILDGPHVLLTTIHQRLQDDDGDGIVRYDMGRDSITFVNTWLVADMETGETSLAAWPPDRRSPDPDSLFRVEGGGVVWSGIIQIAAAWIRPGVGHWRGPAPASLFIKDGGTLDGDGIFNQTILLLPGAFASIEAEDPEPPGAFREGDVVLLIDARFARFKIVRVDGPAVLFDFDGDRETEPLTDGLLGLRYLFGLRGAALTTGSVGPACTHCDGAAVSEYLDSLAPLLDIDGDASRHPLTDGILFLRYLFGIRGDALVDDALGFNCTRCSGQDVADRLRGWN